MSRLDIPSSLPKEPAWRLRAAGCSMFGGRWQSGLSKILGVDRRTIVRWNANDGPLPADLNERLAVAFRQRANEMSTDAERMIVLAKYLESCK